MNLADYGRILIRRGWIIILLALLAAGSAYFLSSRQTPVYRAIQIVLIQPARSDFGLTESSKAQLNSLRLYLDSTFTAAKVIDALQLDMTPPALKGAVRISVDQLTLSLTISVDMPDGDQANDIAKAWGEQLVQFRNQENQKVRREDQVNALLQDNPRYDLLAPRPTINAAAGGVLGLLLGAIIVFILEYLESSIVRRREDLERVLDIPVLAAIPDNF
jgi:capsular polysaccharide biosynthesis protein